MEKMFKLLKARKGDERRNNRHKMDRKVENQ